MQSTKDTVHRNQFFGKTWFLILRFTSYVLREKIPMHEMSIVMNLVEVILEEAEKHGAKKVKNVHLKAGKLHQIIPETLEFCYKIATQDTIAAGSELLIEEVPIRLRCRRCDKIFEVMDFIFMCPDCEIADTETLSGDELIIESIKIERGK